jgi:hypothetical protein
VVVAAEKADLKIEPADPQRKLLTAQLKQFLADTVDRGSLEAAVSMLRRETHVPLPFHRVFILEGRSVFLCIFTMDYTEVTLPGNRSEPERP